MNFYPIFLREMIIFKRRIMGLGYLFSSMITPVLYLVAFGLGLGKGMSLQGVSYLAFVVPGICAMSSMTNSYSWIATSVSVGRLHFKTFDEFQVCPVKAHDIMIGEILSGLVRGMFASSLILIAGFAFGAGYPKNPLFYLVWILNCLIFASLGVVSGFRAKSHEDTSTFSNFFILPMAFLCGTFFSVDHLPGYIKTVLFALPLTHTARLMRSCFLGTDTDYVSFAVLAAFLIVTFAWGVMMIRRSNRQ